MKKILVTGGAGYIGAHVCAELSRNGFAPVSFDILNSMTTHVGPYGCEVFGSITNRNRVLEIISQHRPSAIIHLAAHISVEQSQYSPFTYYANNVGGALTVFEQARNFDIPVIFSSSGSIYGDPKTLPVNESHPFAPLNPYARTKAMVEDVLADVGLASVSLRYFNVAGADPEVKHTSLMDHLIPNIIHAAKTGVPLTIYGNDYPTRDGTAIRDYVDVRDLATAHVSALRHLLDGGPKAVFNLGSGTGFTVKEVISAAEQSGLEFSVIVAPRRKGDAVAIYADISKARSELGWEPTRSLTEMIKSMI